MRLVILCVDGLDPDFASKNNFSMRYETRLTIPKELYSRDIPWTPLVWPSMFAGKVEVNILLLPKEVSPLRLRIRKFLISHGIRWRREGLKISRIKEEDISYKLIHMPRVAEELVIDNYDSFIYHIPCVSNDYMYGCYPHYAELEWEQFNVLALCSKYIDKDIIALYIRIVDHKGHDYIEGNESSEKVLREWYKRVFELVDMICGDGVIMLISDHGTLGGHTDYGYLGCTEPVRAESVLDVRHDIERILNGKGQDL